MMTIPFSLPTMDQAEIEAIALVIGSGWLAAGPETAAFEQEFSDYISPPGEKYYCIFTNCCTNALKLAYKWAKQDMDIEDIIYPDNTFCATYAAAIEMGLIATTRDAFVFDVAEGDGYTFRAEQVNMHYGSCKDTTPCLIEDSAHRIEPNDPLVGKIRCYSFHATKNMTTGSGGMFVTNQKEIYERARLYWRDGLSNSTYERAQGDALYAVESFAGGYDANDIAAAIGRVQLKKLPEFTRRRNQIVSAYNRLLNHDWTGNHLYPYPTPDIAGLRAFLKEKGIATSYHYLTPEGNYRDDWQYVSLPLYPSLTNEQVAYIASQVKAYENR